MWIIFLLSVFSNGYSISKKFSPILNDTILKFIQSFLVGSLLSVSFIYFLTSYITRNLSLALGIYFLISLAIILVSFRNSKIPKVGIKPAVLFMVLFLLSFLLFSRSFGYDNKTEDFLIASNLYQDFGAHIPLIRSFSLGNNFPSEVPFFANGGLVYHFMFDFYTSILEILGLRIDLAFNLISAITFSFLTVMIFKLGASIFKDKSVGILAVLLFLFNSSLSFLNFFSGSGLNFVSAFWHNAFYNGSGPLGDSTISVFWNLNTYLNQRHLVFGVLLALYFLYCLMNWKVNKISRKNLFYLGLLFGLIPFWHISIFFCICLFLLMFFIIYPNWRKKLLIVMTTGVLIASPQLILIKAGENAPILFNPGFILSGNLTSYNLVVYWIWNLGLSLVTIPLGFILSKGDQKKFFYITIPLFLVANLFQLGNYIFDNHKLLNLWIIFANFYTALFIVYLFRKKFYFKLLSLFVFIFLILSGIINFIVIKNDVMSGIRDYKANSLMTWSLKNIPDKDVVFTNGEIYDPLSLIGKKIFLGLPRYVYLYGGDPQTRQKDSNIILESDSIDDVNKVISENRIKYMVLYKNGFAKNEKKVDYNFFKKYFKIMYEDKDGVVFKI